MNRLRKLVLTVGLGAMAAGAGAAITFEKDAASLRGDAVDYYASLLEDQRQAELDFLVASEHESGSYVPQDQRRDYSTSQAHSVVEKAKQKLDLARGFTNDLVEENPEVRAYVSAKRKAHIGYIASAIGFALSYIGFRKSILE